MIKARHAKWAEALFDVYVMRLMKRQFHRFHLFGEIPRIESTLPLLLVPNHASWWDGFFVHLLNRQLFQRRPYIMMLESELRKYHFFSRVGAFSIDPGNAKKTLASLQYAVSVMKNEQNKPPLICLFPQGELAPWGKRPLDFKSGIEWLIRKYDGKVNVLPVGIRSEYRGKQHAEVFFMFGKNQILDKLNFPGMPALASQLEFLLEDIQLRIQYREDGIDLLNADLSAFAETKLNESIIT